MHVYGELHGTLTSSGTISGFLSAPQIIEGALTIPSATGVTPYTGDYEVTPSTEAQTLSTNQLFMDGDVIINPIPNNYGLITYNGVSITVS